MDDVTEEFFGPGNAEAWGLTDGLGHAGEDFAVEFQPGGVATVVEGQDVGDTGMAEVGGVEARDFGIAHEVNGEGEVAELEILAEERGEE